MAGPSLQRPIGVGPALEKARRIRGLSLDEAARDTRLRVDQLTALERESFEALPSDAFVRGALRTYSQYLGVSSDKVLGAYARNAESPAVPPPPRGLGRIERAIAATRVRDSQRFLWLGAVTLVLLLLLFGFLARDRGAPAPAVMQNTAPEVVHGSNIDAVLVALRPIEVTVTLDGAPETHTMDQGETRSFSADEEMVVSIADGGAVQVSVGGTDLGAPGEPGSPWTETFTSAVSRGSAPPSPDSSSP